MILIEEKSMPKKRKGHGFDRRKDKGRHLRRGYVSKKTSQLAPDPEFPGTSEEQEFKVPLTHGKCTTKQDAGMQSPIFEHGESSHINSDCESENVKHVLDGLWCIKSDCNHEEVLEHVLNGPPCIESDLDNEELVLDSPLTFGEEEHDLVTNQILDEHAYYSSCTPSTSGLPCRQSPEEEDYLCKSPNIENERQPDSTNDSQQSHSKWSYSRSPLVKVASIEMAPSFYRGNLQVPPLVENTSMDELLLKVSLHVNMFLPSHCFCAVVDRKIDVGLANATISVPFAIQRAVSVTPSGEVQLFVHNKPLPSSHKLWDSVKKIGLLSITVESFSKNILEMVTSIRSFAICEGVKDYQSVWKTYETGVIDNNPFLETRYSSTFRSSKCLYLVVGTNVKRCRECSSLCLILRQRHSRKKNQMFNNTPPANKGIKYLTSPQKDRRLQQNRKTIRNLREQNARLRRSAQN